MDKLDELNEYVKVCRRCGLCEGRANTVFGEGSPEAKIMFVGEGPGEEEDRTGRPFVGKAGQLLTMMINAIGLKREEVYIANIVKCRPPNNRVPLDEEGEICINYLRKQVAIIRPRIIVCLGATASKYIIDKNIKITRDRGKWYRKGNFNILPTFHPSALLRDENKKKYAWEDFKKIREMVNSNFS